jgi:FtsZ-interacting cell division protein ZipA
MSELQLALIGAGGVAVAIVWVYNAWQERKHRKLAEKVFGQPREDALMQGASDAEPESGRREPNAERREPSFGDDDAVPVAAASASEPAEEDAGDEMKSLPAPPAQWADEVADCALRIEFVEPVAAPALWAEQAEWAGQMLKSLRWLGFDERAGQWKLLTAHDAGQYGQVVAALQMADRQGPAAEAEIAIFLDGVHRLAQNFSGLVDVPDRQDVLAHAQALDTFCASVDVQLGVHVVEPAGNTFAGTKLRGLAEAAGMQLREDGFFHALRDDGETLFVLGNAGPELFTADGMRSLATPGIVLTLDVPRAADGQAVFDRMIGVANQFALGLGGALVDAQRRSFDQAMIAGIRAKIGELQQRMNAHKIQPGSVRALRLFS